MKNIKLDENLKGDDYVVGDIHGEFTKLETQLKEIGFDESKDRLIAVGDLIDRGPESHRVLEFLEKDYFFSTLGNHETFLMDYHEADLNMHSHDTLDSMRRLWARYGGGWIMGTPLGPFYEKISKLPLIIEVPVGDKSVAVLHAEIDPEISYTDLVQSLNDPEAFPGRDDLTPDRLEEMLLWERFSIDRYTKLSMFTKVDHSSYNIKGIDLVCVGHTPMITEIAPFKLGNTVYLDSGAVFHPNEKLCIAKIKDLL